MEIRVAKPEDYNEIYRLVKTAFQTAQVSDGTEQEFVLELRASSGYIPELEFVAFEENAIVGHIMLTTQPIKASKDGICAVLVAPLCVALPPPPQKNRYGFHGKSA